MQPPHTTRSGVPGEPDTIAQIGELRGHTGPVDQISFAPDGALLASTSDDATLRLWDVATQSLLQTLDIPAGAIAFSPVSQLLAAVIPCGIVQLLGPSGQLLAELPGHEGDAYGLAFSSDGRLLAVGSGAGRIRIWDVATRRVLVAFVAAPQAGGVVEAPQWVEPLGFSPDGQWLAIRGITSSFGPVQVWQIQRDSIGGITPRWRGAILSGGGDIFDAAFSPNGSLLAVADMMTYEVCFFDTSTLTQIGSLDFVDYPCAISFSIDGNQLAVALGISGVVALADIAGAHPALVADFPAHTSSIDLESKGDTWMIGDIAWSPNHRILATSGMSSTTFDSTGALTGLDDYTIKLWRLPFP